MTKKYLFFLLTLLIVCSYIPAHAKSVGSYDAYTKLVEPYKVKKIRNNL